MSPEAVQLLSSNLNAVYFGVTAGPNLAIPLTKPLNEQNKADLAIGGASLGVAIASIVSSNIGIPLIGTLTGAASLGNNLQKIVRSAVNDGVINDADLKLAAADLTGILGTVSLGLAGAAVGGTGGAVALVAVIGAAAVVTSTTLIIQANAASNGTIDTPEIKAMADAAQKFFDDFGDTAKLVTDAMLDPVFWDIFADKGTELLLDLSSFITSTYDGISDFIKDIKQKFLDAEKIISPIVLDLNGDGIATTNLNNGVYFDHDGNGLAERTAWINGQDGLLVRDLNSNGKIDNGGELFGSETLLLSGEKAANGYLALAELDENADKQIDSQDAAYTTLKIWQDANGDGKSSANELFDLAGLGIQSIATNYTTTYQTDANGNIAKQTSTFNKTDDSINTSVDIWFQTDKTYTVAVESLPETPEVAALPNLSGHGNVYNLHQAMLRDSSGHLQALVQQFTNETDLNARHALVNPLIYAWAGVDDIRPNSRGYITDARQLAVLETFLAENYTQGYGVNAGTSNTGPNAGRYLTGVFMELEDTIYSQLMAQTHFKFLFDSIAILWDASSGQWAWDVNNTVSLLETIYTVQPDSLSVINDFADVLKSNGDAGQELLSALRAKGNLVSSGFAELLTKIGLDTLTKNAVNNVLRGGKDDDELLGMGGNDSLYGNDGNDTLDGGADNDYLQGGVGDDVYRFDLGSGSDEIFDNDSNINNVDTVEFGVGITPASVLFSRSDYDLILTINGSSDQLILQNFGGGSDYQIEQVKFADGTVWDAASLYAQLAETPLVGTNNADTLVAWIIGDNFLQGMDGNDTLYGFRGNDSLDGGADNDKLFGELGNDTLNGGIGEDMLMGDADNDSLMGGEGDDRLYGSNGNDGLFGELGNDDLNGGYGTDTLQGGLGDDLYHVDEPTDSVVEYDNEGYDVIISTSQTYTLPDYVEKLTLMEGLTISGTGNAQTNFILGNGQDNTLDGQAGIDTLQGGDGNDIYIVDNNADLVIEILYQGNDTVGTSVSNYTLPDNLENLSLLGADALNGSGNALDNRLYGNMGDNALAGLDGTDQIFGAEGDDQLDGGGSRDILQGDAGNDRLDGGDGDDALDGGTGVDTMLGGLGDDVYQVIDSNDVSVEVADAGYDTVYARADYTLGSYIEDLYLTGWQAVNGAGNDLDNQLIGNITNNLLQGLAGNDRLIDDWGNDTLQGGAGNDSLDGGYGMDFMQGGSGDDSYVVDRSTDNIIENTAEGLDAVQATATYALPDNVENLQLLGDFAQQAHVYALNGTGNTLDNDIQGNDGVNVLGGLDGQDTIDGRAGNDRLNGDAGNDTLYGGDDALYFYLGEGGYEVPELADNTDVINGQDGNDSIDGGSGDDQLYGSDGDDVLYGGDDGLGVDIPMWESFIFLTNADILDGGTGQDMMDGGSGNDSLYGGDGGDDLYGGDEGSLNFSNNDFLDGGAGIDTMRGGSGDDTYIVDGTTQLLTVQGFDECHIGSGDDDVGPSLASTSDLVIENPNEGYDIIYSSVSLTLPDNVEEVDFTGTANIDVIGNADFNIIIANAGNNRLDGGLGADTMIGSLGDDVYFLDSMEDSVVEQADEGMDTVRSYIDSYTLGANLENLDLVGTATMGVGNELNNLIRGNALGNLIDAGDGNDFISGAGGDDTLYGGLGDDSYVFSIGFGNDIAIDTGGNNDEVRMNDDLTVNDITLTRQGDDVVLGLKNSSDRLVLNQWFNQDQRIESIRFCDGTVMDSATIENSVNNQAPVATDDVIAVREDTNVSVTGNALINDSDPDTGDSLSLINPGLYSGIYGNWELTDTGDFAYTLNNDMTAIQSLGEGQSLNETLTYNIQDNDPVNPLTGSATITVTIEGSNDAPILALPIPDQSALTGEPVSYRLADNTFVDIDRGDVLTLSAQLPNGDPLPAWLSFDAVSGLLSGTPSVAGDVQIQVTATDTGGLSVSDVFTLAIAEPKNASVSGFVYLDADNNGLKNALETGLAGVTINLTGTDNLGNSIALSTLTDADGSYLFDRLNSGTYQLNETQPNYIDGKDSAGSLGGIVSNDQISAIMLKAGENSSNNNFGEQRAASLGDKVWNDSNANGIQDANESGIAGVSVKLLNAAGAVQLTTTTDNQGNYLFNQLAPGTYTVQVTAPNNYSFTGSNQGNNDTLDSDVDPLTGKTQAITLITGETNISYDAGLSIKPASSTCLTFNFKGNSATDGTDGNIRSYTEDNVSVNASAFSRDKSTGDWNKAWLGSYSGGLGVTDSSEKSGSGNSHTVDNTGRDNYVLFEFSTAVVVDKAYLGYVLNDSDAKVWIGTFNSPFNHHLKLSDSVLSHFGFTELNQTTLSSARWADLNAQEISGNTLIIAADTTDKSPEDNFKIQQLKVCVPGIPDSHSCVFGSGDAPGVGTHGFWKQWTAIWDGDNSNDCLFNNKANFADEDILYTVTDPVTGTGSGKGLLVGDWNGNGVTDHSERTLFYSPAEAKAILSASDSSQDCRYLIGKQLLATWLNVIAGNNADNIETDINNGIEWLQNHTPNEGGSSYGDGNLTLNASAFKVSSSNQDWQVVANPDPAHSGNFCGAAIKNVLDYYNNTGAGFAIDRDSDDIDGDLVSLLGLQTYRQEFHA